MELAHYFSLGRPKIKADYAIDKGFTVTRGCNGPELCVT